LVSSDVQVELRAMICTRGKGGLREEYPELVQQATLSCRKSSVLIWAESFPGKVERLNLIVRK
jgi:hypothetical protein